MKPILFSCSLILLTLFFTPSITSNSEYQESEYSDENFDESGYEGDSSSSEEDYRYDIHGAFYHEYGHVQPGSFNKGFSTTTPSPSGSACTCGRSNVNTRIVGGQVSANHAWPWMAAITNITVINTTDTDANATTTNKFILGNKYSIFCGGSIINNRYILTAGHCGRAIMTAGLEKFRVIVGTSKINGGSPIYRRTYKIASARVHPKYVSMDMVRIEYDAALLELDNTLVFNNNVVPICLGQNGSPYVKSIATVAGWGNIIGGNQSDYSPSNSLRDVNVQVISNNQCNKAYASAEASPKTVSPSMICAYSAGRDSCSGDSGGPLFLKKSSPQFYRQIGIVSYGEGCATQYPGVYTRVQRILPWIRTSTKNATYCSDSFSS